MLLEGLRTGLSPAYYPCKTEPTARQSSYFVRSAFVGLCHDGNNTNLNVNIYIENISQIKMTNLNEKTINKGSLENQI